MASYKTGLDYYSHYIGMTRDKKFRKARTEYGSTAIDVWLALLDMIYSDKGYYLVYDDLTKEDVVWEVLDYVKGKYSPNPETVVKIIECLVACGLFSGDLFKRGILSSKRIQTQYYAGTAERKAVVIDPDIWLLDINKMKSLSERNPILRQFENRPNIEDNRPNIEDNRSISEQSKVKQSKIKENKIEESKGERSAPAASPSSSPQNDPREDLVSRFGEVNVQKYERKFRNWAGKKPDGAKIDMYRTIGNWLEQDGVTKPQSSINDDDILRELREQYSRNDEEDNL